MQNINHVMDGNPVRLMVPGAQALKGVAGALGGDVCLEDGMRFVLNDFEPVADIVGMVVRNLRGDAEVGIKESGAEFCD